MTNPFKILGIEALPVCDLKELRKLYIKAQQTAHPDLGDSSNLSEMANQAYQLLKSDETRIRSILELNAELNPNTNVLSPMDLMEFMDLSDQIDTAKNLSEEEKKPLTKNLEDERLKLKEELIQLNDQWKNTDDPLKHMDIPIWKELLIWFQKSRYLSRLEKNLAGIEEI